MTHWHWLALGLTLITIEILSSGGLGFFLWIGISACMVFFMSWLMPSLSFSTELTCFSLGAIIVSVLWWWYLKRNPIESALPDLNQRSAQYVGRIFNLENAIENGRGRIKIADTVWTVKGDDMPVGTKVKVTAYEGVILVVEKAD